jgi:uncharacterized protein (TIGR03792 family)
VPGGLPQTQSPLSAPVEIQSSIRNLSDANGHLEVAVIEHLRLKVSADARDVWLEAEQASWEPWLQRQPGFLGRDLLWDPEQEEGILLIHWASREEWLAIPREEVDLIQNRFEAMALAALERRQTQAMGWKAINPFPMIYSGELQPSGRGR